MKAIILSAGRGTRLQSLAAFYPKCLLKVGKKTILEHIVDALREIGVKNTSLVIGTKGTPWNQRSYNIIKKICKENQVKIVLNFENDETANSYSLFLAMEELEKTSVLSIDGDIFLHNRILQEICNMPHTSLLSKRTDSLSEIGTRVVTDDSGRVLDIGKNITPTTSAWYIHSGIIKVDRQDFTKLREILKNKYKPLDLSHPLKEFSQKYELFNLEVNQGWINVNTVQNLNAAKDMWSELK
jgi:choline kinase